MDWEAIIPPRPGQEGPLRLGAVPYLYTEPLVHGLCDLTGVPLERGTQAALAEGLAAGRLSGALLPVLKAARAPRLRVVPGIGVCAPGVSAQRLLCRVPLGEVKTLAVSHGDEAMGAVARILLADAHGTRPRMVDDVAAADAVVLAGDEGLNPHESFPHEHDIAGLWMSHTGLPLVLAVWVVGSAAPVMRVRAAVSQAAQSGLEHLADIARAAPETHGVGESAAADYLGGLVYRLGSQEVESMRRLVGLAAHYGFCAPDAALTLC